MVDVKELRIGNLVYLPNLSKEAYGNENVPFCIEEILIKDNEYKAICHCDTVEGYSCTDDASILEIEPIPLTEGLLVKCGFRRSYGCFRNGIELSKMFNPFYEVLVNNYEFYLSINNGGDIVSYNPILYLHQLQNIYFDLTGEELEVEL